MPQEDEFVIIRRQVLSNAARTMRRAQFAHFMADTKFGDKVGLWQAMHALVIVADHMSDRTDPEHQVREFMRGLDDDTRTAAATIGLAGICAKGTNPQRSREDLCRAGFPVAGQLAYWSLQEAELDPTESMVFASLLGALSADDCTALVMNGAAQLWYLGFTGDQLADLVPKA